MSTKAGSTFSWPPVGPAPRNSWPWASMRRQRETTRLLSARRRHVRRTVATEDDSRQVRTGTFAVLWVVLLSAAAPAQYLPGTEAPIQFGQVHLYVPDVDAQKRFWTVVGAERYHVLTTAIGVVKFPNTVFFLNERAAPA